jgi:hypothetical protein
LGGETQEEKDSTTEAIEQKRGRPLDPAARRALAEAEKRRAEKTPPLPREIGGRDGPEPTRYGDWENKGIASDF